MTTLASYDSEMELGQTITVLKDLALEHCRLAGPDADTLAFLIKHEMWSYVCSYNVLYDVGLSVDTVLNIRQALGFFQKLEPLDIGVDKEAVARETFYKSEERCFETNRLFYLLSTGSYSFPEDVMRALSYAKRKIKSVLGPTPGIEDMHYLFGPGATTSVPKRNACTREKLSAVPSCSSNMLPLAPYLLGELPLYAGLHSNIGEDGVARVPMEVHYGKLAFVPKNAKTYRTVITEPTLNALFQSGVGKVMTQRLMRVGQVVPKTSYFSELVKADLVEQDRVKFRRLNRCDEMRLSEADTRDQSKNQTLAWEGSLSGALATLDLSSASDLLSYELVRYLLPTEWFAMLALCRTPIVADEGYEVHLHKFSSMGNGITFPLQTLIFWALAKACVRIEETRGTVVDRRISVFGDDIIVATEAVPLLSKTLDCVGFKLNMDKSYWKGPFRESCGKDYYFGFDVRPFYVKNVLSGERLFSLHNFYYRSRQYAMASKVLGLIDPSLRIFGPDGYGDGHLLAREWKRRYVHKDRGYGGYCFDTFTHKPRHHFNVMPGDAVLPAYAAYERSFSSADDDGNPTRHVKVKEPVRVDSSADCYEVGFGVTSLTSDAHNFIPAVPLPGTEGVKRISIYTFMP